jgi:glycosyltransferase involved in cell wall biosynthesis
MHGLDYDIPIKTLTETCEKSPLLRVSWEFYSRGSKLLKQENVDIALVNALEPIRFKPKVLIGSKLPLPFKLEHYKPQSERENYIVHIGTDPVKNVWISIEAIKLLRSNGYNTKLVIVGSPISLPKDEAVEPRFSITEKEKIRSIV